MFGAVPSVTAVHAGERAKGKAHASSGGALRTSSAVRLTVLELK